MQNRPEAKSSVAAGGDWKGNQSRFYRDTKGTIRKRIDPHGRRMRYEYILIDRLAKVILPTGANLFWKYDYCNENFYRTLLTLPKNYPL